MEIIKTDDPNIIISRVTMDSEIDIEAQKLYIQQLKELVISIEKKINKLQTYIDDNEPDEEIAEPLLIKIDENTRLVQGFNREIDEILLLIGE